MASDCASAHVTRPPWHNSPVPKADVIVIGAGAAGIFAAWRAANLGAKVVLLEKTPRIGTKILMSGGGKCNITHAGPLEDVLKAFRPNEARFIRPACYRLRNDQIVEMFTSRGLQVYTREDGRIFPTDGTAKDVVAILKGYLREAGVDTLTETPVESIEKGFRVVTPRGVFEAPAVVLCTGGSSYPKSGTTGDGWPWATQLGHSIVKIRAALAPMELSPRRPNLAGVAARNCILHGRSKGKRVVHWQGDLLFTHQGVSGPNALGVSRVVSEKLEEGPVDLTVDVCPALSNEEVNGLLLKETQNHPHRRVRPILEQWVPESLADAILRDAGVGPQIPGKELTKKDRNRLSETLKAWPIGHVSEVVLDKGEVVAGGVSLEEVDPKTLESLMCPGLFLAGEVLDIAGPVGGYNLQAAFATGFVAGESAAKLANPI